MAVFSRRLPSTERSGRLALALQSLGYLMEAPGEAYAVSQTQTLINDPAQPSLACQGVGKLLNEGGSMPPHP